VLVIDLSSIRASFAPVELKPVEGDLNIVYEDDHLVVINKMPGIAVHPGPAENAEDKVTLVQVLLHHFSASGLSTVGGTERPGIVHRLDQDTSGLMIVCKTDEAHAKLKEVFQRHDTNEIEKIYHAVVVGKMVPDSGSITARIMRHPKQGHKMTTTDKETEGKHALTFYETIKVIDTKTQAQYSLLQVKIATGRTHQIRVHVSSKAHPIVGDGLYSSKSGKYNVPYLLLVAKELRFKHPITGEKLDFEVEYPPHFQAFLDRAAL
jgi:23S rRNA pseudouridine1911/1915/1917 synthase